jgi:ring-1,2-phenylacetyl-CoA epoxidase subunit PaaC
MGMRHAQWIAVGPFLEEDLAFTSIAQDELGHARALYGLLSEDVDALALQRPFAAYRSAWLTEDRCAPWEEAFVRHVLYDEAEAVRWEGLVGSGVAPLADVARRALSEEAVHTAHARPLLARLLVGTDESRRRMTAALDRLLPLAQGLFEPASDEAAALEAGVLTTPSSELARRWRDRVADVCAAGGLDVVWPEPAGLGGRAGRRSDDFAELHQEMTKVYALDPNARW